MEEILQTQDNEAQKINFKEQKKVAGVGMWEGWMRVWD